MNILGPGARSILSNATYLFGSQVATTVARGIYVVVLARALGPESFGVFNYAIAWYLLFISLTYLGLDAYLVQRISTDRSSAPALLRQTLILRSGAAVIVAVGSCLVAMVIDSAREAWQLSGILAFALIGRALWMWAVSACTAFEQTRLALQGDAIFRPLEIGAALLVLLWRPDLYWLAATHAALWCAQGAFGVRMVAHKLSPFSRSIGMDDSIRLLARTLPAGMYTVVVSIFMQAPIVMMRLIERDEFRLGQFALAYQTCMYLLVIPYLISAAMLPVVSRAAAMGDGRDVEFVSLLVRAACICGATLVIVGGPAVAPLATALFGAHYAHAGQLLEMALWLSIPFAGVNLMLSLFLARHAYGAVGFSGTAGAVGMLATMFHAISLAGHAGALVSVGAGMWLWLLLLTFSLRTQVPAYERSRSLRAYFVVFGALLAHLLAADFGLWLRIATGCAALVGASVVLRPLDGRDLQVLKRAIADMLGSTTKTTLQSDGARQ